MKKLKNDVKLKIDKLLKDNGEMLEIIEEESGVFDRVYYNVKLKATRYISVEYHPINVTKEFIKDIEIVLSEHNVFWIE